MKLWGKLIKFQVMCNKGHEVEFPGEAAYVEKGGGCGGCVEYCYCPSPYANLIWDCPRCPKGKDGHSVEL